MNIWDQLVDCICRPPRDLYNPNELLGGSNQTFMVGSMEATRIDFELENKSGQTMKCSHYLPLDVQSKDGRLPVVVYCHCNSGSRRDAEEAVWHLLPCGVGVVAFDFTGSGLSDGKWVTLGAHEVDDLAAVIHHLRSMGGVSNIGLWGRSMGAVTALMYSHKDPDIAGMVLDSPFSRLTDLMLEIVVNQKLPIPKVMLRLALKLMRSSVKRKAGCDINSVSPLDVVSKSLIPAMFGHGEEDSFISILHSEKLHAAYNAAATYPVYKNLVRFNGDHNHPRPAFFYSSVCCFFHQQLGLDHVLFDGTQPDAQRLLSQGSLNLSGEAPEQIDRANGFINTPWSLDGMPHLNDLPLEEQQAAAAAAAAVLETYRDDPSSSGAGGGPAAGSSLQELLPNSEGDLNSPKAVRSTVARRGLELGGAAPAGRFDDIMRQQQQQHKQQRQRQRQQQQQQQLGGSSQPMGIAGSYGCHSSRSNSISRQAVSQVEDAFEVGSRGNLCMLGSTPSPVAPGAPSGLVVTNSSSKTLSQQDPDGSSSTAGGSIGGSESKSAALLTPASPTATDQAQAFRHSSPLTAAGLVAAGGQSLKRLLLGKNANAAGGSSGNTKGDSSSGSNGHSAGPAATNSRNSIDNSAIHWTSNGGNRQGAAHAAQLAAAGVVLPERESHHQYLQHQQHQPPLPPLSPTAATAAAISPLAAAAASSGLAAFGLPMPAAAGTEHGISSNSLRTGDDANVVLRQQPRARMHNGQAEGSLIGFGVRDDSGAWVGLSIDDSEADMDPELAAAIAASLQEQQQLMGAPGAATTAAAVGGSASMSGLRHSILQPQSQLQSSSRGPVTAEEEEEMLKKAIELSLVDVQQESQQECLR